VGYRTVSALEVPQALTFYQAMGTPAVLLQDLPSKISQRVIRSVSWADLDTTHGRSWLGRVLTQATHGGWRAFNLRLAAERRRKRS
jgi:hypothetical protein